MESIPIWNAHRFKIPIWNSHRFPNFNMESIWDHVPMWNSYNRTLKEFIYKTKYGMHIEPYTGPIFMSIYAG